MQIARRIRVAVEAPQELHEFARALAGVAFADDDAVEDAQSGEEGGGAVPVIVMRVAFREARLQRQEGPRAIQGLNVGLGVHAEDHGFVGWIQIEADDIAQFVHEARVLRELEPLDPVRLQPVLPPDLADHRVADALRAGHLVDCSSAWRPAAWSSASPARSAATFSAGSGARPAGREASVSNAETPPARYRCIHK